MPPVIVIRRLQLDGKSHGPESGEALSVLATEDMGKKVIEEKERIQDLMRERGEDPPIAAISLETLTQEEITKINTTSEFAPAEGAQQH